MSKRSGGAATAESAAGAILRMARGNVRVAARERPGEGHCGTDYKHIYQLC